MTVGVSTLKMFIRQVIAETEMLEVPPKRANSGKVHLEVWKTKNGRAVGLEMGHDSLVNLWLVSMYVPRTLPQSVLLTRKVPKGREWTDQEGKGANSNLSAYDEFRTKPVSRLAVTTVEDARCVLEAILK